MRDDLPSGTVTFLFTDVEGSTRLLHELGPEAYGGALAEHRRVIREACAAAGGVEVDTQGDAFFFAFHTAPAAIAAAEATTTALAQGSIQVRIGLHTGTPLLTDEGYVGGDVHRAARIAAAGHAGQVLVSAATGQLVELELTDLGEHRLKDLSAPERIYQLGNYEFPALKSLYRTNLPIPATPFLGREREVAEVVALLNDARLLTLTGPGGTGKTRLALQAVAAAADSFPDGVFWVPLAALRDPELVVPSAEQALGARSDLSGHIADKRLLLLLDNFEQVVEAAPELGALLASCPNVLLMVTSRELLRIAGELEYPVPPLAEREAVELFGARSQLEPDTTVAELCRHLDNLPLAVELAAARTKALTPQQILERLSGRLDFLKGGRDADPRQQTLRATIEWSYGLLSSEEQQLFARLSVFSGGCTLEAADEVVGADFDTLESLVDKSLIRRRDTEGGPRLWMLETIRELAAERLADSETNTDVARRHLEYYLALAREIPEPWELRDVDVFRIEPERDNFRVALDTALTLRPALATELAGRLATYWLQQGHRGEARASLAAALDADPEGFAPDKARALRAFGQLAQKDLDSARAEELVGEALVVDKHHSDLRGVGADLNLLGAVSRTIGDLDDAARLYEESVAAYDEAGEEAGRLGPLTNLAMLARIRGDYARAITIEQEVAAAAKRGRYHYLLCHSLNELGMGLEATGKTEEARQAFEECIVVSRSHGFMEALAHTLSNLAHLEQSLEPSAARAHYRESIELMRELQEWHGIAECLEGFAAVSSGDATRAATLFGAAAVIREDKRVPPMHDAEIDAAIQQTRQTLGAEDFSTAQSLGAGMSLDEAVEYALSGFD